MNRKKTITELKKIFAEKDTSECKNIPESEQKGYMDPCNVLMVVPLTNVGKDILVNNFEAGEPQKIPELFYKEEKGTPIKSKYSTEYLRIILEFIKCFGNDEAGVIFEMKEDYPLSVTLKHFKIILAPRVDY